MSADHAEYRGDVFYEEYRRGLPEGSISDDRIADGYYDGTSPESLVSCEQQRQAERNERLRKEQEAEWQDCQQWEQEQPE